MKTVKEILMDYLKAIGTDGLAGDECGCGLDDFMPCYAGCGDCVPARKEIAPADHEFAGEETYVPMEPPADSVQGLVGRFVTAKLRHATSPRQGWVICADPLLIRGESGTLYECEGEPTIVVNPPSPNTHISGGTPSAESDCYAKQQGE